MSHRNQKIGTFRKFLYDPGADGIREGHGKLVLYHIKRDIFTELYNLESSQSRNLPGRMKHKKYHGHYCRVCGCNRTNEKFTGKGHKNHICKDCSKRPAEEIEAIGQKDDIYGFMDQSNISPKNVKRLQQMVGSENPEIQELASLVLEVAEVKPRKRRRLKFLAQNHPRLFKKLEETNLIETWELCDSDIEIFL